MPASGCSRRGFLAASAGGLLPANPVLRIGAVQGPQAELMAHALAGEPGIRLSVSADKGALIRALANGGIDASASHSAPELQALPKEYRTLAAAFATVTLPTGIYSHRVRSIAQLRDGDTIVLPKTVSEYNRARVLLYNFRLLFAHEDDGLDADFKNIVNPRKFAIRTDDDGRLAARLRDAAAVVMPYDTATAAGLRPAPDSIGFEDGKSPYAQVVAVRRGDIGKPWLGRLVRSFQSRDMRRYIMSRYGDSVEPPW